MVKICPSCGGELAFDEVDVGIGVITSPAWCPDPECGYDEKNPYSGYDERHYPPAYDRTNEMPTEIVSLAESPRSTSR